MATDLLTCTDKFKGQVAELTFGPAPANIITAELMGALSQQLKQVQGDKHKKLIVLCGTGKHFSYGASVEEHQPEQVRDMLPRFHRTIGEMLECRVPILAKVSGLCLGGGFEIALACTFIFADESARFAVPEIQLGVFPPPACALLPLKCGDSYAAQLILTGDRESAQELLARGLINQVVETGNLDAEVDKFIENQILPKSASSLRLAQQALRTWPVGEYEKTIAAVEKLYLQDITAISAISLS